VRAVVAITVFVVVAAVGSGGAKAEKRTTDGRADAVRVAVGAPVDGSARTVWSFGGVASLASGSPVALRSERDREARRKLTSKQQRELDVFAETQTGAFDPLIADAARTWAIDPFLLKGLLYNESKLDPNLTGKRIFKHMKDREVAVGGGARGIAQFTTDGIHAINEAREKRYRVGERVRPLRKDDVWDPEIAIPAAAELLATYIDRFGRDGGITAYNSGPYAGKLVAKHGFYRARHSGKLSRLGTTHLQGHRFLLNVLRWTNRYRRAAGLERLPKPRDRRTRAEKSLDRLIRQKSKRRKPNS